MYNDSFLKMRERERERKKKKPYQINEKEIM